VLVFFGPEILAVVSPLKVGELAVLRTSLRDMDLSLVLVYGRWDNG